MITRENVWDWSIGTSQGLCPVILLAAIADAPRAIVVGLLAIMFVADVAAFFALLTKTK